MTKITNFNTPENYLKTYTKTKKSDVVPRVKPHAQIAGINLLDIVFHGELYFSLLSDFIAWVRITVWYPPLTEQHTKLNTSTLTIVHIIDYIRQQTFKLNNRFVNLYTTR